MFVGNLQSRLVCWTMVFCRSCRVSDSLSRDCNIFKNINCVYVFPNNGHLSTKVSFVNNMVRPCDNDLLFFVYTCIHYCNDSSTSPVLEATSCAVELQCTCLLNTHRLYSVSFSFWEACMFSGMVLRTSYFIVVSRTYVNLIDDKWDVCRLRLLTQCDQYTATASMWWSCIVASHLLFLFSLCVLLFTFVFPSPFLFPWYTW